MILKEFETEVAHDLEKIFANFKYDTATISGRLKTSLLESTSGAQREITNYVAMLSNR